MIRVKQDRFKLTAGPVCLQSSGCCGCGLCCWRRSVSVTKSPDCIFELATFHSHLQPLGSRCRVRLVVLCGGAAPAHTFRGSGDSSKAELLLWLDFVCVDIWTWGTLMQAPACYVIWSVESSKCRRAEKSKSDLESRHKWRPVSVSSVCGFSAVSFMFPHIHTDKSQLTIVTHWCWL